MFFLIISTSFGLLQFSLSILETWFGRRPAGGLLGHGVKECGKGLDLDSPN